MQQLREVAHGLQRAVGDRLRLGQRLRRAAAGLDGAFGKSSSTLIAVSTWPTSSCSSRAMVRRSSSCAFITFAAVCCSSLEMRASRSICVRSRASSRAAYTLVNSSMPRPMTSAKPTRRGSAASATRWIAAMSACWRMNARRLSAWISSEMATAASRCGPMWRFNTSRTCAGVRPAASASTCSER